MKFRKYIVLALASLIPAGCSGTVPALNSFSEGIFSSSRHSGQVRFKFSFPEKFLGKQPKLPFSLKTVEVGKINRVKLKISSVNKDFVLERTVDLVPGGIEVSLNLPLDYLYTVSVQGMNNGEPVSGSNIKGFFPLVSASNNPLVEISQNTTPIATVIEEIKSRFSEIKNNNTETEKPVSLDKVTDLLDISAISELINRARGNSHPSLVNTKAFVEAIIENKKIPQEIPEAAMLKPGRVKGQISGLRANEVAIVTVGDPFSRQTIVVTPPVVSSGGASADPDAESDPVDFLIDNVTPGEWKISAMASGYTQGDDKEGEVKITVSEDSEATQDFSFTASEWLKLPLSVSGNIGNSEQADADLDPADNIHLVWQQDGFMTDSNSGVIFYSRWNGTSWTTQNVNVSQIGESGLRGSQNPSVAVGLDRLPHVIWSAKNSSSSRGVYYNYFNGTNWKTPMLLPGSNDGTDTDLTVDRVTGFIYAVWESNGNILFSRFDRERWSNPINIGSGSKPKIVCGVDGLVHLVWKSNSSQKIKYASYKVNNQSIVSEDIPFNVIGSDNDNYLDLSVDRFSRLHVIWRNSGNIQYIFRSNTSWSQSEIVNQISGQLLEATTGASMSVSPTGIISVSWTSVLADGKEVIRFRRRLNSGWKEPFKEISELGTTTLGGVTTSVDKTENLIGYENIPLSHVNKVEDQPIIINDSAGRIHVIWSNKGSGSNDTDLLHSIKGKTSE